MSHRLDAATRLISTATAGAAAVAAFDVLDRADGATWALLTALLLAVGGALVARLHAVAIEVHDDVVVVTNVLTSHRIPRDEVVAVAPGRWRSAVLLADGSELPTLLRDRDLAEPLGLPTTQVIDLRDLHANA